MAKYIGIKVILNEFKKRILLLAHPVHSLYMSTDPTSPETLFGGKWASLPAGCFVRNAGGAAGTVGQTQNEGLPNLWGAFNLSTTQYDDAANPQGVFWQTSSNAHADGGGSYNNPYSRVDFNAQRFNNIYGNSAHVTPYNVAVYMWWRTR